MAVITDYIITDADINAAHVGAQPDILRGTAAQNKQAFDNYGDMISEHFNNLITYLEADTQATIDDSTLLLYTGLGWTPSE